MRICFSLDADLTYYCNLLSQLLKKKKKKNFKKNALASENKHRLPAQ